MTFRRDVKNSVIFAGLVFLSCAASAQNTEGNLLAGLEINTYFDLYYQSSPQAHQVTPITSGGPSVLEGRFFDRHVNQMTLNMAEVSVKKKSGKVAFRADLAIGEMVDQLSGGSSQSVTGGGVGQNPTNTAANEPTRNLTQAIVTYTPTESFSLSAGKFFSHMGYEVTKAKDNWQYSRSYTVNYGIPFWHQGVSGAYKIIPEKLTTTVFLLNGWEGRNSQEQNKSSTLGLNINFSMIDGLVGNYNYIGGAEATDGSRREVHEVSLTYALSPTLTIAADHLIGTQKSIPVLGEAKWSSISVYINAQLTSFYSLSPRFEVFDDSDQGFAIAGGLSAAGTKQKITSWTISNNFDLGDGLQARLELRSDKSDSPLFFKDKDGLTSDRQESYTAAVLYAF